MKMSRDINLHPTEPDHFDPKRFLFIVTQILVRLKKILPLICRKFCKERFGEEKNSFRLTVFAVKIKVGPDQNGPVLSD